MSKYTIDGFNELVTKLERLGKSGKNAANKGLKEAGKVIVDQQKKDGPRHKGGPSNKKNKHGADALKVGSIRIAKASKNKYVQIGITDSQVWEYAKGVYFHHHGFYNHISGKYIAGSQWFDSSFEKAKGKAANVLMKYLEKEINL